LLLLLLLLLLLPLLLLLAPGISAAYPAAAFGFRGGP
jgi:hypothetical protein